MLAGSQPAISASEAGFTHMSSAARAETIVMSECEERVLGFCASTGELPPPEVHEFAKNANVSISHLQ